MGRRPLRPRGARPRVRPWRWRQALGFRTASLWDRFSGCLDHYVCCFVFFLVVRFLAFGGLQKCCFGCLFFDSVFICGGLQLCLVCWVLFIFGGLQMVFLGCWVLYMFGGLLKRQKWFATIPRAGKDHFSVNCQHAGGGGGAGGLFVEGTCKVGLQGQKRDRTRINSIFGGSPYFLSMELHRSFGEHGLPINRACKIDSPGTFANRRQGDPTQDLGRFWLEGISSPPNWPCGYGQGVHYPCSWHPQYIQHRTPLNQTP